jgi:hypothetical protein
MFVPIWGLNWVSYEPNDSINPTYVSDLNTLYQNVITFFNSPPRPF